MKLFYYILGSWHIFVRDKTNKEGRQTTWEITDFQLYNSDQLCYIQQVIFIENYAIC